MLLTYAGRLPGTDDFPSDNVEYVREQVERLIANLRPRVVVGSAAAGADLLVVTAALKIGATAKVVLAGTREEFRASSVTGSGPSWVQLFDSLDDHDCVDIIEVARHEEDAESYQAVTKLIRDVADSEAYDHEPTVSLNVSAIREGQDHSADLAVAQEVRDRLVLRIDPTRRVDKTPTAFVAMPFGRRRDPEHGWYGYEADASYQRIILPALIDSGYRPVRADAEALLEVIDLTMLRAITTAEVVVADLATLNPNVMWEVGVRHAWRRAGTILLRPDGTTPPFDVSHARVHAYTRAEAEVDDADAVAGILLVRRLLAAVAENRTDSPVFMTLPELPEPQLPSELQDQPTRDARRYIEQVSLATDLRDCDELQHLADAIRQDTNLNHATRRPLLEQIGLALIAAGRHDAAVPILGPLAEDDTTMEHVRLQQQYAHALIRSAEPDGRAQRIELAEGRLQALLKRRSATGETYGLLGSAAKVRVEDALSGGQIPGAHLGIAIDAYLQGFRLDPGDYYPGIVALALLRLRGQHIEPNEQDVEQARDLLPVVRFAAMRLGQPGDDDAWVLATIAELALHDYFLHQDKGEALVQASGLYARVAAIGGPDQRASATRQLQLLRDAGDQPDVLDALLALFTEM